ncbi:MAG: ABC transporter permease [Coriobacteriia bacterium]|nr:ABC transporter permease [Coriobacteriia bacterium]
MGRLWRIAVKDLRITVRDRGALLVMLAMPLALIFILGSALGNVGEGDSLDAEVAIVNDDAGEIGDRFVEGLTSAEEIDAVFNVHIREDSDAVRTEVERGDLTAALVIPADLTEKVESGEPVALEVPQDPGSEISAGVWTGVVRAGVAHACAQIITGRAIAEALPGGGLPMSGAGMPELGFDSVDVREIDIEMEKQIPMLSYYAAAMSGMFLLFGGMFGAFSFARERREQTLARMMATPASAKEIVGGKALGVAVIGALQFLVLLAGTSLLFPVDWGVGTLAVVLVGFAEVVAAAGFAMALAALGKTERAIGGIAPALIMLFSALGGAMIPIEQLPSWLHPLQVVSPVYWTIDSFLELMRGGGLVDVLPGIGAVLLIGMVLLGFGAWRVRYE